VETEHSNAPELPAEPADAPDGAQWHMRLLFLHPACVSTLLQPVAGRQCLIQGVVVAIYQLTSWRSTDRWSWLCSGFAYATLAVSEHVCV
jgi:hypothetical protein